MIPRFGYGFFGGLGAIVGAILLFIVFGQNGAIPTRDVTGQNGGLRWEAPSSQQTIPEQEKVYVCADGRQVNTLGGCNTVQQAQNVVYQQVQQPAVSQPAQQPQSGNFTCPGTTIGDGGCLVTGTTNVPAGGCVSFDPRSTGVEIGGARVDLKNPPSNAVVNIDTDLSAQVKLLSAGQYVGIYPATIYPIC